MGRVPGIPYDSEVSDTRGLLCLVPVGCFKSRFAKFSASRLFAYSSYSACCLPPRRGGRTDLRVRCGASCWIAQGAAIASADIVAIRVETGMRYHSATGSAGRFAVDLLPPGEYSARAEADGMSPQVSPMIRVEVGAATQVTFKLKVAGPRETITVWEAPRVGDPNPSSVSGPVEERAIKDLPLNGRRFTDLPLLMPGVTQDPRGQTGGSNGDLSYGGLRGYNTSFLVDGGDNRPPSPPRSAPS